MFLFLGLQGIPNEIDLIAASFVRKGTDLDYIREVSCAVLCCPVLCCDTASAVNSVGGSRCTSRNCRSVM